MRKAVILTPAFIFALTASAFAQAVDKSKDRTETVKITVSGQADITWIYLQADGTAFQAVLSGAGTTDDSSRIAPNITVRLDVELTDKVSAVLELGTLDVPTEDTLGNSETNPVFKNAYIQLAEVLDPALTLRVGQIWTDFDIRGRGQSLIFDSFYSDSAAGDAIASGIGEGDLPVSDFSYTLSAGAVLDYKRDAISLQVGAFIAQGDTGIFDPETHDSTYYASFFYNLESMGKGSRVGAFFGVFNFAGKDTAVFTLGGGVDLHGLMEGLEVFGEVYFQFGDAGRALIATDTKDAGGFAFNAGAHYNFASEQKPWIEVKITWLTGDDDALDDQVDNFISRENVRDLMILEDPVFGLDIDTNTTSFKFGGGVSFTSGSGIPNNIQLSAWFGFVSLTEETTIAGSGEDGIGSEFDVHLKWVYSKAVDVNVGVGFLFGSDIMEATIPDEDDSTFVLSMGVNAKY